MAPGRIFWLQGPTDFWKIWDQPPNSKCDKGDMQQVLYYGPTVLEPHCCIALSAKCMWTDTHVCMWENKNRPWLCWKYLVDRVTSRLGFMHPSLSPYLYFAYVDIPCGTESGATTAICVCVCVWGGGMHHILSFNSGVMKLRFIRGIQHSAAL